MKLNVSKNDLLITFIAAFIVILAGLLIAFAIVNKKSKNEASNTEPQIDYYNELRKNISKLDFAEIERRQIECYLK